MAIYFVSDFHFGAPWIKDPLKQIRLFSRFIEAIQSDAEHLYIIGDLFDFWFEYRDGFPNRFPEVTSKLRDLHQQGCKITFIGGNHDWWAGKTFISLTGAEVARGDIEARHYDRRIYIGHGDGIAHAGWAYRLLRRILRNRINILLFSQLPSSIGLKLAKIVSSGSHTAAEGRQWQFFRDYEEFAGRLIRRGFDAVLIGHTHIPQRKELNGGLYLNTGDWIKYFTFVELKADVFHLKTFANGKMEPFDSDRLQPPARG